MTYSEWKIDEDIRKGILITKLQSQGKTTAEIVGYFDFDNMKEQEPDYCPLYLTSTKCHNIEKLNCFFCGCPHFEYNDDGIYTQQGKTVYSKCTINAPKGAGFLTDKAVHQDCSNCNIPHKPDFIRKEASQYIDTDKR